MHLSGSRILKEKKKTKNQNNMSYAQQSNVCKKRLHEQQSLSSSKASKGEQMKSYPFIDTYVIHHILQSLPVPGLWMCVTRCQDSKFMSETPLAYSVNTNLIHPWKMEHNPPCIKFSLEKETVIIGQKQRYFWPESLVMVIPHFLPCKKEYTLSWKANLLPKLTGTSTNQLSQTSSGGEGGGNLPVRLWR